MGTKANRSSRSLKGFQELLGALMIMGVVLVLPLAGIGIVISGVTEGFKKAYRFLHK